VFRRTDDVGGKGSRHVGPRNRILVAGPGSSTTIPGIIVSEIMYAMAQSAQVTRVEVDLGLDFTVGLHRAPSLAVAHHKANDRGVQQLRAPDSARFRAQAFREWMTPEVGTAIAYAWPGIDNSWIKQYLQIARNAGVTTVVAVASLPSSSRVRALSLADDIARADLVLVGDPNDATALVTAFGGGGPIVESHRALSLSRRGAYSSQHQITAFLPRDSTATLSTLLAAFDAIPEAWIHDYHLQVVMRHGGQIFPEMVTNSYHGDHVSLISSELSRPSFEQLCATSSVLGVADPAHDSRAFATAIDFGIATVVLSNTSLPEVGRSYVGGLLADLTHPASVHVALIHALRLAELSFPSPDAWDELAQRLDESHRSRIPAARLLESVTTTG
jgi:hypothetical protein